MVMNPAIGLMTPPVRIEHFIHARGVQQRPLRNMLVTHGRRDNLAVEVADACLLLFAKVAHPRIVLLAEHLRADLVEDIRVARCEWAIPRCGTAPRDDREAPGIDVETLGAPA